MPAKKHPVLSDAESTEEQLELLQQLDLPSVASIQEATPVMPEQSRIYYTPQDWKGVKMVYHCETCGQFRDLEDDMILHVLEHVPEKEREQQLSTLLSAKENK